MDAEKPQARLEDLSPEAQAVIKDKRCVCRVRVKKCLRLLEEVAQFDAVVDQLQKKAKNRGCLFIFIAVACLPVGFLLSGYLSTIGTVLAGVVCVPSLVASIVFFVSFDRYKRMNLENDFRQSIVPLLTLLEEDVGSRTKIDLTLNFDGGTAKTKQVSLEKLPPPQLYRKVTKTTFVDPWCSLKIPLVDGAVVSLDIVNTHIRFDKWKKRKNKHKVKWQKHVTATVAVTPSTEGLDWDGERVEQRVRKLQEGTSKRKLKSKKESLRLSNTVKFKEIEGPIEKTMSGKDLLAMLMELYSLLRAPAQEGGDSNG